MLMHDVQPHVCLRAVLKRLKSYAITLNEVQQLITLLLRHVDVNIETQANLLEADRHIACSTPSVPRRSTSPSAQTDAERSGISSNAAAAFTETPAQATSASSSMSPAQSSKPEPPALGCIPAIARPRPVSTLGFRCWRRQLFPLLSALRRRTSHPSCNDP